VANGENSDHNLIVPNDPLPKKVSVIFSEVKREYFPTEAQYLTEVTAGHDAQIISGYLNNMGVETVLIPGDDNILDALKKNKPDMVFQLVDSVKGYEYLSSSIPGVLEMLDIPYTGADVLGLSLCFNKFLVKQILQHVGVPVPNNQLFITAADPLNISLRYPLISKLNEIHGAVEITTDSISENEKHLRERLKFLISTYKQPVLVEEFIAGREITAVVLEGLNTKVYMAEKKFEHLEEKYNFVTFGYQWLNTDQEHSFHYERYTDDNLKELVRRAFDVSKMSDYGKFDIRMDSSGRYFFVDANPNSFLGPKENGSALGNILENLYGVKFTEILRRMMLNTVRASKSDFGTNGAVSAVDTLQVTSADDNEQQIVNL
jgi:D-alanine-D-alanine ligase